MIKTLDAQHALDSRGTTTTRSRRNVQFYWLVLFCISAESFTSCFVPNWKVRSRVWNINLSPTFVNLFGAFLEGAISTIEKQKLSDTFKPISRLFRGGFLGVFTSFSYVVEHASRDSLLYLVGTVIGGCSWYMAGRHVVLYILATRSISSLSKSSSGVEAEEDPIHDPLGSGNPEEENTQMVFHILKWVLVMFNLGVLGLAFFGPPGFVREPQHPLTLWRKRDNAVISDGPELLLGMIWSVVGILCSRGIAQLDLFSILGLERVWQRHAWFRAMDWSTWKCNVCSVYLTLGAYRCMFVFPQWKHNVMLVKFITSFCSSLSCFSATVGNTMALWYVTPQFAMANMAIHVMSGLLFVPFF